MQSAEIREKFLEFFSTKGHKIVASAPLVVKDDPTLMFTNAGMNQFKDYFLGNKRPTETRVADTQKCLRVSGKHNDLEDVGKDTYHHTMFEMLGNWSFGDYFKEEAINWGWELLTDVYKLPTDRLYVTVFGGDKGDDLGQDEEAYKIWKKILPDDRILFADKKDNFWEMGDTGPCGPCSEIHIDLRSDDQLKDMPGRELVNKDHPEVIEIWNLVFIQYNRLSDGRLEELPQKHIDTGMGFERLAMAIQDKKSNYDTDVFTPLIREVEKISGYTYGKDLDNDIAIRVIVDHIRAVCFAIADGQLPSNNKAGYVIRRILRRAIRYGFSFLDLKEPFMNRLVPVLAEQMGTFFPEISRQKDFVQKAIEEEETSFLRTLEKGLKKLEVFIENKQDIGGAEAFELYDTYGFPLDLTQLIARENGLEVDQKGFEEEMARQKSRSRAAAQVTKGDWVVLNPAAGEFVGYDTLEVSTRISRYREVEEKGETAFQIVLESTPFYAESGGQVGDRGWLIGSNDKLAVKDTQKENDLIIHWTNKLPEDVDQEFLARVDAEKRQYTADNHSATHLLHAALREVLGPHVEQRGSLVNEKMLRFDFSHVSKMTPEEVQQVEEIVNAKIRANIRLDEKRNIPMDEAKKMGAMALFGEKYGNFVRVITFDPGYSVELCGGTHVTATGNIGLFKIVSEASVAAGVRRIEAITAREAEHYVDQQDQLISQVNELLKSPQDIVASVRNLLAERNLLAKKLEKMEGEKAGGLKEELLKMAETSGPAQIIATVTEAPNADALKKLSFELRNEVENLVLILGTESEGKALVSVMIDQQLVDDYQLNAGQLIREVGPMIKGGGGGQPFYATAGGKNPDGLEDAVSQLKSLILEKLK